mgnify:FL=1|tara:strand:+ start:2078 stop:2413 length:336 start_codon:yes stop_codon:yes gene_type:complete
MKISLDRLKEIITEEVARATAIEEGGAAAYGHAPPPLGTDEPEPEPESASMLARFLARIKDTLTLSPETWKDLNDVARKMHDDEMTGFSGHSGDTPRYMESLNIEIVEDKK